MRLIGSLVAALTVALFVGCGGTTTTTVTESDTAPTSSTGCVNVSSGEPADCEDVGAVEQDVYDMHNDGSTESTSSTTTTAVEDEGGLPTCQELKKAAKDEGKCQDGLRTYKVVNSGTPLDLDELSVEILGYETTDALTDVGTEVPNGVFLIFNLAVTNKLSKPVYFDDSQEQVAYWSDGNVYSEDFDAENGGDESSFLWQGEEIQPGTTQTGTVIFDVPPKIAERVEKDGNLYVLNFSDADSYGGGRPELTGIIRTWRP